MRNRREFLKTVAGAATGAYVAGRQLPGARAARRGAAAPDVAGAAARRQARSRASKSRSAASA